ncbi:HalOD1 output domain-containing protein [Natronobeatus ordinarius]|uniref:HalOD1 output domain-containing protein n=1 Tax=Natronobeatus ordinarius TaxID=2963433 RepID=UPI0020CE1F69|nr:HalOD1 output domain-containing protein [Natronobeatus ordinarius]
MDAGESVSVSVVRAVAAREDVQPVQLTPPLHDAVDTDALDALFRSIDPEDSESNVRVEFSYRGYTILVEGPSQIVVTDRATTAESDHRPAGDSIGD